jgi:hypothetical protein
MHQHLTHNKTYPTSREFADAILNFPRTSPVLSDFVEKPPKRARSKF